MNAHRCAAERLCRTQLTRRVNGLSIMSSELAKLEEEEKGYREQVSLREPRDEQVS